jgi:acetyl esterase
MFLDPEVKSLLVRMTASGIIPTHMKTVAVARADFEAVSAMVPKLNRPIARIDNRTLPGPAGPISVRVYAPAGTGPFPILVFLHGGGWVQGSLDTHDDTCRALAHGALCVVVSVDYRLAPEHKFPAGLEDCYAATKWLAEHRGEIGGDGPLAIAGDSAGGNLAAAVTLLARERGGLTLAQQVLIYPVMDYNVNTPSYLEFADGPDNGQRGLMRDTMIWFWEHYLPRETDRRQPLVSPLQADNLSGLPPALVLTAECDVLRDEGEAYVARLRAAGTMAAGVRWLGMCHGFVHYAGLIGAGRQAIEAVCGTLRATFAIAWANDGK